MTTAMYCILCNDVEGHDEAVTGCGCDHYFSYTTVSASASSVSQLISCSVIVCGRGRVMLHTLSLFFWPDGSATRQ